MDLEFASQMSFWGVWNSKLGIKKCLLSRSWIVENSNTAAYVLENDERLTERG